MPIFDLRGTPEQQAVLQGALDACDFPFELLQPGMAAKGWTSIPVEFADLSRAASVHEAAEWHRLANPENRKATLGLYWYKGLIQIEASLATANPRRAQTVFLAEGAHAVDDCYVTDAQRAELVKAMHPDGTTDQHGWFDVGPYAEYEGEAFMASFVAAYAPSLYDESLFAKFAAHKTDPARVREILTPAGGDATPPSTAGPFTVSLPAPVAAIVVRRAARAKLTPEAWIARRITAYVRR